MLETMIKTAAVVLCLLGVSALFVVIWCLAEHALARLGGWHTLARFYRARVPLDGQTLRGSAVSFGFIRYWDWVQFTAGNAGLGVSCYLRLSNAHPPLLIPWSELTMARHGLWPFQWVELGFAQAPKVRVSVMPGLAEKLIQAGGEAVHLRKAD
jgi:hypothetical protein